MRGDLHIHSNWSDGTAPILDMAAAAQHRGYAYIALTDHSRRVTVAHGLDAARLSRQIDEIDKLNAKLSGFTVLKGMEVDILADGHLDMTNEVLSRLDIVVAAVHYKFDLSRDKQTRPMPTPRLGSPLCVTVSTRHDAAGSSPTMSSIRGRCRS